MDIPGSEEEEISMPISTSLAAMSDSSRLRMLTTSALAAAVAEEREEEHREKLQQEPSSNNINSKKKVRYRECMKNHAANLGGHVTDGCGEFMPSGEKGTAESLRCAACECHRNFHRREVEGECECYHHRRLTPPHAAAGVSGPNLLTLPFSAAAVPRPQMMVSFGKGPGGGGAFVPSAEAEEREGAGGFMGHGGARKRFRTKFSQGQKDRMLAFAQKLGWRIQKQDEVEVQRFCQDVGVKRHVLKVWMHNNKHTFSTKSQNADDTDTATATNNTTTNNNSTSTATTTTTTTGNTNNGSNLFK